MREARWIPVLLVFGVALVAPSVKANSLGPGGLGPPDSFTLGYSYNPPNAQVRQILANLSGSWGAAPFSGRFYEQVDSDPANPFCSGCVDFLFQVTNDGGSNQNISRIEETAFSAYQTDVGYDSLSLGSSTLCGIDDNGFCNSGNPATVPNTVDRSVDGNVVGFNFVAGVPANDSTVDIVIETDTLNYTHPVATVHGSNGGTGTLDIYGPSGPPVSAVPELSSVLLLTTGLLGLAGVGVIHRKRSRSPTEMRMVLFR